MENVETFTFVGESKVRFQELNIFERHEYVICLVLDESRYPIEVAGYLVNRHEIPPEFCIQEIGVQMDQGLHAMRIYSTVEAHLMLRKSGYITNPIIWPAVVTLLEEHGQTVRKFTPEQK